MRQIPYKSLSHNRGTIVQYKNIASIVPWCFPEQFIPTIITPGVAPIIGVRFKDDLPLPFIAAVTVNRNTIHELNIPRITALQNLKDTLIVGDLWLKNNLPLWLQRFKVPNYNFFIVHPNQQTIQAVDGGSAGLSCILATISDLLQMPLKESWAYSATITQQGELGPVNAIEEKLDGIIKLCPKIKHFVVGRIDQDYVDKLQAQSHLHLHRITSIQSALATIPIGNFPSIHEAIQHTLSQIIQRDTQQLNSFVQDIFLSCLQGVSQIYGWGSLCTMLSILKKNELWNSLSKSQQFKLEMSLMISCRYSNESKLQNLPLLKNSHLVWGERNLHIGEWAALLPHLLQQLTEMPDSIVCTTQLIALVKNNLPDRSQQWIMPLHLKLAGAWGRYLAQQKHIDSLSESFEWQLLCFNQWSLHGLYFEASYPLCAMMYLHSKIPGTEKTILQCWDQFKSMPNARVLHSMQFMPEEWRDRLQSEVSGKHI